MQATARMASVVSSTPPARRRLIRVVRPTSQLIAMPDCPVMIDGAVVILSATLDPSRHKQTRTTRLFADGTEQTWFHGLAIARYGRDSKDGDVYLFYCDESWETSNDCCYSTIEEALAEAANQFGVRRSDWRSVTWPFDQTRDTATISTTPVFRGGHRHIGVGNPLHEGCNSPPIRVINN